MSRVSACVVVVVGLHAGLLAIPVRSGVAKAAPMATATPMQVRLLPQPSSRTALAADTGPPVRPRPTAATPAAEQARTDSTAPALERDVPVAEPVVTEAPAPPEPNWFFPAVDADDSYLPRSMLSVAPSPTGPVVIDYPAFDGEQARYVSELSLFIDTSGRVLRVRVEGKALPQALEEAARSAFLGARFQPGQQEGRAVRSRIRVEVSFDTSGPGR